MLEELPDVDRMVTFLAAVCGLGGMAAGWLAAGLAAPRKLASAVLSDPLVLFIVLGGLAVGAWLAIDAALVPRPQPTWGQRRDADGLSLLWSDATPERVATLDGR